MKLVIACDHAGCEVKNEVIAALEGKGHEVKDFGCYTNESVNYPDYAHLVCKEVQDKRAELGILICGTGIGMSMAANKHIGIRAAVCPFPRPQFSPAAFAVVGKRVPGPPCYFP